MSNLTTMLEQRIAAINTEFDAVKTERTQLRQANYVDGTLTPDAATRAGDDHKAKIKTLTARADELADDLADVSKRLADQVERDAAEIRAGKVTGLSNTAGGGSFRTSAGGVRIPNVQVIREEAVYREDDAMVGMTSFFRDTYAARRGDWAAAERLHRNNQVMGLDQRSLSTTAGAGGQFAPPAWLVADWIKLARPARVTADLLTKFALPYGVSSINLPQVTGGTTEAVQATQNSNVSNTDMTTSSASSGIVTIAGQQIVAQQLLDQSGIPFDQIILGDLAADYAMKLDAQVTAGSGVSGQLKGLTTSGMGTAVTWTQASPVVASATVATSFQAQVTKVAAAINNTRYAPATHIVMSPERWGWITEAVDTQGRPLVPPASSGGTLNAFGSAGEPTAQGMAGTFAGLPVYVDPALTVASGNEFVLIMRAADAWLWESELYVASFDAPYANQLGVLFRAHAYSALVNRYTASVQAMTGTGLAKVTLG